MDVIEFPDTSGVQLNGRYRGFLIEVECSKMDVIECLDTSGVQLNG